MAESIGSDSVCVVIGAGHAGSQLAIQVRKEGWAGRIVLVGAEPHLPYHRPPLSKAVLAGEKTLDAVLLRPESMYASHGIELRLGKRAEQIKPDLQQIILSDGEVLSYHKLALCTGASVRHLAFGGGLPGVHYLRTVDDVTAIRAGIQSGKPAVIIGGGYIGLEVAAVLTQLGMVVTILEMADRLLQRVTSPVISTFFHDLHVNHGVRIVTDAVVAGIDGESRVHAVRCDDGREYPADLVVVGVGVIPETTLAAAAGLTVNNGIVVDEYARTSAIDIYAAGDCTWHPSALYSRYLRLESVQNALDQAKVAAANIAGKAEVYDALPWFWSDQYEIKLQSAGLSAGYDDLLLRGDGSNQDGCGFSVFYFKAGRLIAADCVNRAKEFIVCKKIIAQGLVVNRAAMTDDTCSPDQFVAD